MATLDERVAQLQRERIELIEKHFLLWQSQAEIKLLISMIPANEPPELLQTLLRSAYQAGADAGSAHFAMHLAERILGQKDSNS